MIIQNVDRSYQVLRRMGDTEKTEEFLCVETEGREDSICLLVRVTDPVLSRNFTLFLEEKGKREEFTDYRECFLADGALYAVFRYSADPSLKEKMERERCNLKERAHIARAILERLLLLNPHPYFAWAGLATECVTVSSGLEVGFNYQLSRLEEADSFHMGDVCRALGEVMRALFLEEEKKQVSPPLSEYLQWISTTRDSTYLELYEKFLPVYRQLCHEELEQQLPRTFLFRLWERCKRLLGVLRRVLIVILLVAAVVYVVNTFQDDSGSQVDQVTIRQIGDLEIQSNTN